MNVKSEIVKIKNSSRTIITNACNFSVTTSKREDKAYIVLKDIASMLKVIENKRTSITKPINESLREINSMFKELVSPLREADDSLRRKILEFHDEQEAKAAKEEERRHKIQASHEAKGHKVSEAAIVVADTGKSTTQKRWVFDITDINKIPRRYLILDRVMINEAIKGGVRTIGGLKIYQKKGILVR